MTRKREVLLLRHGSAAPLSAGWLAEHGWS